VMKAMASRAALVVLMAAAGAAAETRALPAFSVIALDGTTVASPAVVRAGHWLLVYVRPQSAPSRSLLGALEKGRPETAAVVVVGVGGDAAAAKALGDEFPALKPAAWYADVRGETFRALRLTGVPVVMGMQESGIEWSLSGVVPDRKTLPSMLSSW
jgi:hypothetical protein